MSNQVPIMYRYITSEHSQLTEHYEISTFINYLKEHQLPHAINASHATPTARFNWGSMLLN